MPILVVIVQQIKNEKGHNVQPSAYIITKYPSLNRVNAYRLPINDFQRSLVIINDCRITVIDWKSFGRKCIGLTVN